jgi:CBS domain-containing protein
VDLAARMMDWRQIRHVPVEDDQGKLVGLLSFRALLRLCARDSQRGDGVMVDPSELCVGDIMQANPTTAKVDTSTLVALDLMKDGHVGCLPVVDDAGHLVGTVTVDDLLEIASKVLVDFLRGED